MKKTGFTLVELLVVIAIIGIFNCPPAASRSGGPGSGPAYAMHEQSETDRHCDS